MGGRKGGLTLFRERTAAPESTLPDQSGEMRAVSDFRARKEVQDSHAEDCEGVDGSGNTACSRR